MAHGSLWHRAYSCADFFAEASKEFQLVPIAGSASRFRAQFPGSSIVADIDIPSDWPENHAAALTLKCMQHETDQQPQNLAIAEMAPKEIIHQGSLADLLKRVAAAASTSLPQ